MENKHAIFHAVILMWLFGISTGLYSQEKQEHLKTEMQKGQKSVYTCPMHPKVTSDEPGGCPECGMNLVLREEQTREQKASESSSAIDKINQARSLLGEAKRELAQEGKYNCCIKDPCDRCALDHQNCPCGDEIKAGKSVCPDCYAVWQRGNGIVKGINAKKVKGTFHSHHHVH